MVQNLARTVMRQTTRAALTGATAGLGAWAATAGVRRVLKRRADEALQLAAQTPLGRILPEPDLPDDGADDEAAKIAEAARRARDRAQETVETATEPPAQTGDDEATAQDDDALAPPTAAEVGAPGVAAPVADQVTEELQREHSIPAEPTRDELPISDWDSATVASLRARLRKLTLEDLVVLREYEQAHAHRLPVVTMLDNRIAKVQAGDS